MAGIVPVVDTAFTTVDEWRGLNATDVGSVNAN